MTRKPSAPRENQIMAEPATPAACRSDYESGASTRAAAAKQQSRRR